MTTSGQEKHPDEVFYAINFHSSDNGWEGRRGSLRLCNVNGINAVNGLFQYRQPLGGGGYERLIIACADDKTLPESGGYVCSMMNDGTGKAKLNSSLTIPTGAFAKWRGVMVHGQLFMCNGGYSALYRYNQGDATPFAEVEPVDGFSGDTSRPCFLDLPIAKVLGTYKSRLVFGNFSAGASGYATTSGIPYTVEKAGPRMLFMSEPMTDVTPNFVVQVKEYFIFGTDNEEELVCQKEFKGQNVCILSDSTHELLGDIATEYYRRIISGSIGCAAQGSLQETPIGLIWLSKSSFVRYDGQDLREISPEIKRIFTQFYGSYVSNPFLIDTGKLWNACSEYDPIRSEYTCWLPLAGYDGNLVGFTYNLETRGWYMARGIGSILDIATGVKTTKEKGYCAEEAIPIELDNNQQKLIFGDSEGFVCMESADGRDAYMELASNNAGTSKTVIPVDTVTAYPYLTASANDIFNGASLIVIDDRTAAEQTAGTFPTGRIPGGTEAAITDCALSATDFTFTITPALPYTPQNGCVFGIFWPIRSRVIDELFAENQKTVKRINSIRFFVAGTSRTTLAVKYQGDPVLVGADEAISEFTASNSKALSGENNNAFQEVLIKCSGRKAVGRKHSFIVETFGTSPAIIQKAVIEHQVLGDR